MSATLDPIPQFTQACGLSDKQTAIAIGHADWRENAYDVAIDCRVDTRLKQRDQYYETTAATVAQLIAHSPANPSPSSLLPINTQKPSRPISKPSNPTPV